jgi:hypothetical protein
MQINIMVTGELLIVNGNLSFKIPLTMINY